MSDFLDEFDRQAAHLEFVKAAAIRKLNQELFADGQSVGSAQPLTLEQRYQRYWMDEFKYDDDFNFYY